VNILIVEDEPTVARMLEQRLLADRHRVSIAPTGEEGSHAVETEPFDLVLLDICLPQQDGHQTLAAIRRTRSDLPVIVLTGRGDLPSKLAALDGGADDYLCKPFAFDELLVRIHAVRRRIGRRPQAMVTCGDLRLDRLAHRVWRGEREVAMARREFALLDYFSRHPERLLSRPQILAAVWEHDFAGESNLVDVYVRSLRTKLDRAGEPSLITTVRGCGYRFDPRPAT
jgi:DNA-binding response OmpR family regulator